MTTQLPPLRAGGDIGTCRFIKVSTAADNTALEADAGEFVIGISTEAAKAAPTDGASTEAAESGDQFEWYGMGNVALLTIGSGGCTRGDHLKSDADGQGVTASAGDKYGAIALESASAGEKAKVYIVVGELET